MLININFLAMINPDKIEYIVKDTHRKKAPTNEVLELTESRNMSIWVVGTHKSTQFKRFLN